jgi:uncharacterized protein (UPF0147 family)
MWLLRAYSGDDGSALPASMLPDVMTFAERRNLSDAERSAALRAGNAAAVEADDAEKVKYVAFLVRVVCDESEPPAVRQSAAENISGLKTPGKSALTSETRIAIGRILSGEGASTDLRASLLRGCVGLGEDLGAFKEAVYSAIDGDVSQSFVAASTLGYVGKFDRDEVERLFERLWESKDQARRCYEETLRQLLRRDVVDVAFYRPSLELLRRETHDGMLDKEIDRVLKPK